jgi:hypothetical protein
MRILFLAAACVLATFANSAWAADFERAPNQSFSLDLDTEAGNFSQWRSGDLTGFNALRTRMTFVRLGAHSKWAPSFHLSLVNGGERATFDVTGVAGKKPLIASLVHWKDQKEASREAFLMMPEAAETFALEVDWTPTGEVTVVVRDKAAQALNGFERRSVSLAAAPSSLEISGSTGEVTLSPLELGRTN